LSEGANATAGGKKAADRGYFVQPTVLTRTTPQMKVVREEIFGPVVCALPFSDSDLERIAQEANNTEYGLAASIWTRDISVANKMAKRVRSGTVWINCHNVFDAALPFGGYKQSGWGREMGGEVLNNYTEVKAVALAL
jgi:acyl-CoA reductase-like NAD-dependent aldehyde dehydrogenase